MIKKLSAFFILLLTSQLLISQNTRKLIVGTVKNTSLVAVKDVHIINLNTRKGTITNNKGVFEISVAEGDSLLISNILYQNEIIKIDANTLKSLQLNIYLLNQTNQLEEVFVKMKLDGILGFDLHKKPVDRRAKALRKIMDFSKVDMEIVEKDDYIDKRVRPQIVQVDPVGNFGAKVSIGIPFKHSERMWALRRNLEFRKRFPTELKTLLGEKFFFKQLKIPKDKFHHFLEYCNPLGIENLYKTHKILEVIKILRAESKSYLNLIKKQ